MSNIIIACDEKDTGLGNYFNECRLRVVQELQSKSLEYRELNSAKLNELAISVTLEQLNKFIFCAFSHGDERTLLKSGVEEYVSLDKNGDAFNGGFVYTFSCSSGKDLGKDLINNHSCDCFIGYDTVIYVWTNYGSFIDCAVHGLIEFIGGKNSSEVILSMKKKYDEEIDRLEEINPFAAADLAINRNALVKHGKTVSFEGYF